MPKKQTADPFAAKPKTTKANTRKPKRHYTQRERPLPEEGVPATTTSPSRPIAPTAKQAEPQPVQQQSHKILPVRITAGLNDRLTIAAATEGVKRGQAGKQGFSKTTLANEAMTQWLDQNGY
jgi:hypothetical protein